MTQQGCPNCGRPFREQPSPTQSEMTLRDMPDPGSGDDMGGNPLQEGILGDWKQKNVRDESFASVRTSISTFETPEFETSELVLPPDLYQHALKTEAAHRANVQIPNGITDNLHTTLGNLQAWTENPYENSALRPYNKYWKAIRPSFSKPSSLQIGVADPTMAEIINHVAQTDDLTPLHEYRGKTSSTKTSGPAAAIPAIAEGVGAAGAGAEAAGAAAGGAEAASAGAGLAETGGGAAAVAGDTSAGGIGGVMNSVMNNPVVQNLKGLGQMGQVGQGIGMVDDALGMGSGAHPGGGGGGGGPSPSVQDTSYYARSSSDEDNAFPDSHDEAPKNEDGDAKQKDDGNNHEWQRDLSVNDMGGTDHAPSFDPGGAGVERFMMILPLLMHYMQTGQDGSQDPLVQGLHQSLEQEMPGYLNHADDGAAQRLIMVLSPNGKPSESPKAEPEKNDEDHTDENSGGKHESKTSHVHESETASLTDAEIDGGDFLPTVNVKLPFRRADMYPNAPSEIPSGILSGPRSEREEMLDSSNWPKASEEICPHCGGYGKMALGMCPYCQREVYPNGQAQQRAEYSARTADTQGPQTPEQIQAVQEWLMEHGAEMGLEGDELMQTILSVPTNPLEFADVLAQIQKKEPPPSVTDDAGLSANQPMPAQEEAPPGATMPVPGMSGASAQQMMSAVERYSADSVATQCPECGSHTTGLLDDKGNSFCHACDTKFETKDILPNKVDKDSSWRVSDAGDFPSQHDDGPVQGVPIAEQQTQEDRREEQDSGHTWVDAEGAPLRVGHEYEMHSSRYDIPDLIRIEAVKPSSIVYALTGEYGIQHDTELTQEEANIERISFSPTDSHGELVHDESLEENNDDNTAYTGSPEHTDMSAPTGAGATGVTSATEPENPKLAWLKEGGANFTSMEQRALIEEQGTARNSDLLNLSGTHYDDADDEQFLFGV